MIMSVKTIVVFSSGIFKCRGVSVLQSRIYVSLQLPLVLDNHSSGIDIRLWVRVISATSDKLREVSHCSCSPAPKVHRLLFSAVRKQLLPLAWLFTQTQTVGDIILCVWGRLNPEQASLATKQINHHYHEAIKVEKAQRFQDQVETWKSLNAHSHWH